MQLPKLQYISPINLNELINVLAEHKKNARILAGGTDVIGSLQHGLLQANYLVDLNGIEELRHITYEDGKGLTIGAATKMEDIEQSSIVKKKYYALCQAIREIGSPQIRAMASLGGNSCNASPCADTPPPLVSYGAQVTLTSKRGERQLLLEDFIKGNRVVALEPDEFLKEFFIPEPKPNSAARYNTVTLRAAVEIDLASIAVNIALQPGTKKVNDVLIAMGSVAPYPKRARAAEKILIGNEATEELIEKCAESCFSECEPIDDLRSSAAYRREVVKVLARKTIKEAISEINGY